MSNRIPPELKVHIPESRTAQYPAAKRDQSRLLIYDRNSQKIEHLGRFNDIVSFIAGDILALNDSRVIPARVHGWRRGGGEVEVLFVEPPQGGCSPVEAKVLINPSRRLRIGSTLTLPEAASLELLQKDNTGQWSVQWLSAGVADFKEWLFRVGEPPLPPYIQRPVEAADRERYQTVYANKPGSLAAPTAGLHFTNQLLKNLKSSGCDIVKVTLEVGLGTFIPIREMDITAHQMHRERYYISTDTANILNEAVKQNRKLTCVGTTVVRTLEAAALRSQSLVAGWREADLFIYPPYEFRIVRRLITNFHRPDSTLIQLLAALIGWEGVNLCYQSALDEGFRFYSYGDAMLVI